MEKKGSRSLIWILGAVTLARFFLNTSIRIVYPFAPAIARGLSVSLAEIYFLITLRNATGFLSPVFGPLSEKFGRKAIIIASILLFALGCLIVAIWPNYLVFGISLIIIGLTKVTFDPAMQAYIGDTVPYKQRGRAISITEYAWSLALLIGAPVTSILIRRQGWQAPFIWLGISALVSLIFLIFILPDIRTKRAGQLAPKPTLSIIKSNPVILFAAFYVVLVVSANELLFIVFGGWLEDVFQLSLTGIGLAAAIIGVAELVGEFTAGISVDRFGKRPVIIFAGLSCALFYFLLPFLGSSLVSALVILALIFVFFELTVVGGMPLMTELVPTSRAVVMSLLIAAMMLGRTIGAFVGPFIWDKIGIYGTGVTAAVLMVIAVIILARWVREGK